MLVITVLACYSYLHYSTGLYPLFENDFIVIVKKLTVYDKYLIFFDIVDRFGFDLRFADFHHLVQDSNDPSEIFKILMNAVLNAECKPSHNNPGG